MRNTPHLIGPLVRLLRPKQWVKNGFVAAPLLFSNAYLDPRALLQATYAVLLFCLAASAVYLFNDLHDLEQDRLHPEKAKTRPLASGQVQPKAAWALGLIILITLLGAGLVMPNVLCIIGLYLLLNLAYTLWLKQQPVIDLFCIALGFVLRVYCGAIALTLPVSNWMFITTLSLALYLAATKRRQEYQQHGNKSRPVLTRYSLPLLDYYAQMSATGALVFYSMFVMSAKPQLIITVPIVLFGLFRYAYLVQIKVEGESPTDSLLNDRLLSVTVLLWVIACGLLLNNASPY